ncbi:MAG: argininosuccinate lyase [Ruminococcaceae bacterium]|nr:argininosuccinate lyase [Oscillospiraceae bacterium]
MKLWGGRFTGLTDNDVDIFNSSISFDQKMYKADILGSIVHAQMLGKQGIITQEEAQLITEELDNIKNEIESGAVVIDPDSEDIHTFIEGLLTKRIGDAGKRLHTARSRNDQVALDVRLYLCGAITETRDALVNLISVILDIAEANLNTIMPGFTHMQHAQPVTLAHHMNAYAQMFKRDVERLFDCYKRTDVSPLGSGALAGSTYPIDRQFVADTLGMTGGVTLNSMDSVSDRDFVIELASCYSIIMMHLSRFCEELITWSTSEFGFVTMDDGFSTGSSIMPQKKNPDVAELVRGKTGRVYGNLMALLTVMKSLPLAYNKDMQEDKEAIFDSEKTVNMCLKVFAKMLATCNFNKDAMYKAAFEGYLNSTDFADYITKRGVPFRASHKITGELVVYCIEKGINIEDVSLDVFNEFCSGYCTVDEDIYKAITPEACVTGRAHVGGPAPERAQEVIDYMRSWIKERTKE